MDERVDRGAGRVGDRPLLQHRDVVALARERPSRAQPCDAGADDYLAKPFADIFIRGITK